MPDDIDYSTLSVDETLDRITANRLAIADLNAINDALLDRLDQLLADGEIDPGGFTHNDWSFSHCPGRRSFAYPPDVRAIEAQLKAAKIAAEASGSAIESRSASFWSIKQPRP
jgi:hypothetical protein